MTNVKTTSKGTELPLLNLKGKPYLQVAHRLVWFREDHPIARISTEALSITDKSAVFKAIVTVLATTKEGNPQEVIVSTGHKKETEENFSDFIEKAETGAIGRALALAGYGTQFEPDLDEGERLADAPIATARKQNGNREVLEVKKEIVSKERLALNETIRKAAKNLAELKKQTLEEMAKLVRSYNVSKIDDLTNEQANEVFNILNKKLEN